MKNRLVITLVSCLALTACHTPFAESNATSPPLPEFTTNVASTAVLTAYQTTTIPDLAVCDFHPLADSTPQTTTYQIFCRNKVGETVVRSIVDVTPDLQGKGPLPAISGQCTPPGIAPADQVINITETCNYNGKPLTFAITVSDQETGE